MQMKVLILGHIRNTNKLKILLLLWYGLRSAILRGPAATFRIVREEKRQEKIFGISTAKIKPSSSARFFHYQGASYRVLFRLFGLLPAHVRAFAFVDIGSGKGRAAFVAENCGFRNILGIELDGQLFEQSVENLRHYRLKWNDSQVRFVRANAINYQYDGVPTVYFLFNPFDQQVLSQVLENILAAGTNETWFIYMNPLYPRPFAELQIPLVKTVKTGLYTEAFIYCRQGLI
jgi:hypothetical protein